MARWSLGVAIPIWLAWSVAWGQTSDQGQKPNTDLSKARDQVGEPTATGKWSEVKVDPGQVQIGKVEPLVGSAERKVPTASDETAPPAPPPRATGVLDPRLLREQLESRLADLELCRERVAKASNLAVEELPAGQILLRFTILTTGLTRNHLVLEAPDARKPGTEVGLMRCIRNRMVSWRFTPPVGGPLDVEHPYSFAPPLGSRDR